MFKHYYTFLKYFLAYFLQNDNILLYRFHKSIPSINNKIVTNINSGVKLDNIKKSLKNNISIINNVVNVPNIVALILLNGTHNLYWYISIIIVFNNTAIVLTSSVLNPIESEIINNIIITEYIVKDIGKALCTTSDKKFPWILSLLGSIASIKLGAPIVIKFISDKCIGLNG